MRILSGIIAVIIIVTVFSCKTSKTPSAATSPTGDSTVAVANVNRDTITDLSAKKVMKDKELYAAVTETIKLDTAYLESGVLHLLTRKINACDIHKFKLIWSGAMSKSLPPQAATRLFLLNDTHCKEEHRFHLTFNISSIKMKEDSVTAGATIIKVSGWSRAMKYQYSVDTLKK